MIPKDCAVVYQHLNDTTDPDGEARLRVLDYPRNNLPYVTYAFVVSKETHESLASGISICNPKDRPNRKLGNAIARGRALKKYYHG